MEDVYKKACNSITCKVRSVTKASKTVAITEVVYYALNKMNFFTNSLEITNTSVKARIKANTNSNNPIKFQSGLS